MEHERTIKDVATELSKQHKILGTWQAVGDHYGLSRIVVWRIVNQEYEPKNNDARRKLGLDELVVVRQRRNAKGRFQKRTE